MFSSITAYLHNTEHEENYSQGFNINYNHEN